MTSVAGEVIRHLRPLVLGALVAGAACGPDAGSGAVARVGAWSLTSDRLADLLVLAQPFALDSATVGALVDQWISMAALAQRVAAGVAIDGPEALDASLWLERREALLGAERRDRLGAAVQVPTERGRAEFEADTLRLLAHILRRVGPETSSAERQLQRRTAERILQDLRDGKRWSRAAEESEDAETRALSGLLGLVRVSELPRPLQGAAGALRPGQVSGVVESPEGFHVLYRPRFEEIETLYPTLLTERLLEIADAEAMRGLLDSIRVPDPASAARMVTVLARGSALPPAPDTALATWQGGALAASVVARYVTALAPGDRERLQEASPDAVAAFVKQVAAREVRVQRAQLGGLEAAAAESDDLETLHRENVATWRASLSGAGRPFTASALDAYMERLAARREPLHPLPPLFRAWLLDGLDWERDEVALERAVSVARRLMASAGEGSNP